MRFNPDTERAINIDDIAAQCRAAILKADEQRYVEQIADRIYDEILDFAVWENDVLVPA